MSTQATVHLCNTTLSVFVSVSLSVFVSVFCICNCIYSCAPICSQLAVFYCILLYLYSIDLTQTKCHCILCSRARWYASKLQLARQNDALQRGCILIAQSAFMQCIAVQCFALHCIAVDCIVLVCMRIEEEQQAWCQLDGALRGGGGKQLPSASFPSYEMHF